jgi:hypothetical protein
MSSWKSAAFVPVLTTLFIGFAAAQPPGEIDFDKAKKLRQKMQSGDSLTADEQAYLKRAMEARQKGQRGVAAGAIKGPSLSLKPLADMGASDRYKGEDGGLYGGGQNAPPAALLDAALQRAKQTRPRDADGKPSSDGRIALISVGMSNTTQEFSEFVRLARQDAAKNPKLVIVDGAQGGMEAQAWAKPVLVGRAGRQDPWTVLSQRLSQAGVTSQQVQVAWIKLARANPAALGEYPKHADEFNGHLRTIIKRLAETYPNLRLAYISSRTFAGNATVMLNPEPYAYESAFAVRRLIRGQKTDDSARPLLLWGPYLWTNGEKGRKLDELVWTKEDVGPDGTHPSRNGQRKVAELLLQFFKTDPTTKSWFTR